MGPLRYLSLSLLIFFCKIKIIIIWGLILAVVVEEEGKATAAAAAAGAECEFPAVFNFGDSNSDTGGLSAAFGQAPPPNGETFFGAPVGRYCDGRLVVDFIASGLGLPFLSAYLDSIGSNFSHGANFATAGSSIRRSNTTLFQSGGFSPFSLDVQSWQFSQFVTRSQVVSKRGGFYKDLFPNEEYFSRALYTFDIGQNDLTMGYFHNKTTKDVKAYIPDVLDKFADVIKSVYYLGGRYFWIHNTGPFGCLPYVLVRVPRIAARKDRVGCGATFNEVAQLFNAKLKETVAKLREELPLAALTYVDVYSVKYELISRANKVRASAYGVLRARREVQLRRPHGLRVEDHGEQHRGFGREVVRRSVGEDMLGWDSLH
ncbi:alpha-L-fucosidase 3-like isoform X2 [Ananas comosus]|uniref:Alpha-L-fucosidase 3-like isoform X2 n=1 Tax=Ananas comosus TaxID=4615 RepID=A0A6P5GSR6_ANACO|nr:alpha-L-fucosidase 3-like isoform X2 [Ananas comosus]